LGDRTSPRHDALAAAGLSRPPRISGNTGFAAVTGLDGPSPVQRWAEEVALPKGPALTLVEEATGGGKTEAALVLAHRLMADGRAQGLYVALPTMATANAMFERVKEACGRLFAEGERPSLVLAHGRAELHEGFRDLWVPVGSHPSDDPEDERDGSGAAAPAWLADSRKKAFLADLGVGTIDQALLAVLTAKHQSLRLLGLASKVLIVDEAHAYDAYMQEELKRLLEFQAALGGSAIVLSATLPQATRRDLAASFAKGLGRAAPTLEMQCYPLVTLVSGEGPAKRARRTGRISAARSCSSGWPRRRRRTLGSWKRCGPGRQWPGCATRWTMRSRRSGGCRRRASQPSCSMRGSRWGTDWRSRRRWSSGSASMENQRSVQARWWQHKS
jgi:CRISPR-associated endonuclease/helicase Cas3